MEKSALLNAFIQYVVPVLGVAIGSGLSWVFVQLGLFVGAHYGATKWGSAMAQLTQVFALAVRTIEARLRPLVKEFSADGGISLMEAKKLRDAAIEEAKAIAKTNGFELAEKLLADLSPAAASLLDGFVEQAVARMKTEQAPVPANP